MSPTVSVVTSCHNASKYLVEAIESILDQTFKDFEFILIDDGSTDNTLEIIRDYKKKDQRIVVIEKDNTGLADSLNVGIGLAKGIWIARQDVDDVSLMDRIEKQLNYVLHHKNIVLLGTGCYVINETGDVIKKKGYPPGNKRLVERLENNEMAFPHSSVLFRRDEVQRIGGYRGRLNGAEDRDLWLRLSNSGQIACLEEPLIRLRKHTESMTAGNYKSLVLSQAAIISYKLNKQNCLDPIEQEETFSQEFLQWLESRLEQQGQPKEAKLYFEIESRRYTRPGIKTTIKTLGLLINHQGFQLLKHRFFGSDISTMLTREWIKLGRDNHGKQDCFSMAGNTQFKDNNLSFKTRGVVMLPNHRILVVDPYHEILGPHQVAIRFVESLNRAGWYFVVAVPAVSPVYEHYKSIGIEPRIVPGLESLRRGMNPFTCIRLVWKNVLATLSLTRLIRQEKIRLVHSVSVNCWVGGFAARFARIPSVYHIHDLTLNSSRVMGILIGLVLFISSDKTLCVSRAALKSLPLHSWNYSKACVLRNAVDPNIFYPDLSERNSIRIELGLRSELLCGWVLWDARQTERSGYFYTGICVSC